MSVIDIIIKYHEGLLSGLSVTLQLCLIIWTSGLALGSLIGVAGARWRFWIGGASRLVSFVLTGIPVLVVLFWLHFPAQAMIGVVIDPFYTAAFAFSLLNVVAVADTLRPVLIDFPKQYIMAAHVTGLSRRQTLWHIQLPFVLRRVVPTMLMIQVNMLQATLFASLISVEELFRVAQRINAAEYAPVQVYSALAVCFLAVCLPLNGLAIWLQQRFTRNLSEN